MGCCASHGRTPLFIACQEGQIDAARLLLDKGAEVDRARTDGATPLFIACENGHVDVARLLLDKGAAVDWVRDSDDATPLYIACANGRRRRRALSERCRGHAFSLCK